jgi:galactofuranose transport system permease protein
MKNRILSSQLFWPATALILLLVFNLVKNPGFFMIVERNGHFYGSLIDIVFRAAPLILASMGMTLVIATGGVDLSVGAIAALAPAVAMTFLQSNDVFLTALVASLAVAALVGVWNGILISTLGLQPIVATLTAMVAGRGIAQLLLDGQIVSISNESFAVMGHGHFLGVPFSFTLVLLLIIALSLLTRKTALGLYVEALGSNPEASYAVGLNSSAVKIAVYTASGIFAGLAGLLVSSNIRAVDVNNLGQYLELDAILAVVIGGTALSGGRYTLLGSALGALIIQTVSTTINTQGVAVESMLIIKAIVVIGVCLLQAPKFRQKFARKPKGPSIEPTPLDPLERAAV